MHQQNIVLPSQERVTEFQQSILLWYSKNSRVFPWRNKQANNYEKVISEIMLQRTKAESVAAFFSKFVIRYPTWDSLSNVTENELAEILKPIGLWQRRSSSIIKLAKEMVNRGGEFPKLRVEIEKLPGIGQYIANAILLFCHNEPQPLLDVNMARVLERFFGPRKLADIRYDDYLQSLSKAVVTNNYSVEINWAILDLASLVCIIKNPKCNQCVLSEKCLYFLNISNIHKS